jgi:iron complex transport system substrate-binding protein
VALAAAWLPLAMVPAMVPVCAPAWAPAYAQPSAAQPRRIVSLDLCTDQLLIELVDRDRIAAVTHLAADPAVSAIPGRARGLPITHGAAEDVLRHDPDLILAGPFGVSASVDLLRRLGRRVVIVPLPEDLSGVRGSLRRVAAAVGAETRGEALIAAFDARVAALPPAVGSPPTALIYQIGGAVSGPGSLADAVLKAAGLRNMAADYRLTRAGQVPLEWLIADPPELLVLPTSPGEYRTAAADNLRHPVIGLLRQRQSSLEVPWQLWLCGTPHIAEALERLAQARVALETRPR